MGAILAGGESRRMGANKALLEVDGVPIIQHVASAMTAVFEDVRIVADDASPYAFLNLQVTRDVWKKTGPLGGLHAALHSAVAPRVFVLSCDTPFVTPDLIQFILEQPARSPITVVSDENGVQPLCGLYDRSLLREVETRLKAGNHRLLALLEALGASIIPLNTAHSWYRKDLLANINTPAEYHALRSGKVS